MKIYLVGGAVRDTLLSRPLHDKDWVVVNATSEEMLALGYRQVGNDFPVFLHPETGEEFALARTERKTAQGYLGFSVDTGAHVTLEDDLRRRDLTINAIAQDANGNLIDPCGGVDDLNNRILRHISPAFAEDPVRILRTARFAARFHHQGFRVAKETTELMRRMVDSGEANTLVAERVWQELSKALAEPAPDVFFETLQSCGALKCILPEINALWGIPQPPEYHPEIDSGVHLLLCLQAAARLGADTITRYAVLCHDLGKGTTPFHMLPQHIGHEESSAKLCDTLSRRLKAPAEWRQTAILTARYHTHCHRAKELRAATLVDTIMAMDYLRRPERLERFLVACECDAKGRLGLENQAYPQADIFRQAALTLNSVDVRTLAQTTADKSKLPDLIRQKRITAVKQLTVKQR